MTQGDNIMKSNNWKNDDNKLLFDSLSIESFQQIAGRIGLATCPDLQVLDAYLRHGYAILDVGAGWGRALNYLLARKEIKSKLYAVERSQAFLAYLEKHYGDKVNLLSGDIKTIALPKVDNILWLWAGIAEFTPQEQSLVFSKLASALNPSGFFIIETNPVFDMPDTESKLTVHHFEGQHGVVQEPVSNTLYHYYMPHVNEVKKYAEMSGLEYVETIEYRTDTGLKRALHVFKK